MSTKKYLSGNEKRKKQKKTQEFILSQAGALNKFLTRNISNTIVNEECDNLIDKEVQNDMQEQHELGDAENRNKQEYKDLDTKCSTYPLDITDPKNWENIDQNFIDLLVEKGSIRGNMVDFPKNSENRHFSSTYYIRHLSNGEKSDRKWLIYFVSLDKVFCFYCKLFK